MGDAGAFGALLQQQGQPQGSPQAPVQAQPLPAELLPVDGGEGAPTLPAAAPLLVAAPLPETDPVQVRDVAAAPARPTASSEAADAPAPGDAPPAAEDEILPAIDAAVRSDTAIPERPVPDELPVEAADGEAPPADDTAAEAPDANAMPPVLVQHQQQQQPPVQPASVAVAPFAPPVASPPADEAAQNGAVASAEPAAIRARGHDRSPALSAKAQEPSKSEGASDTALASQQTPAAGNAAVPEAAVLADRGDNGLSSPLLTQTLPAIAAKPAGSPYPTAEHAAVHQPVVKAEPGAIGGNVGMEIAKVAKAGRDDLLIRLDPREMGRVDVRLSFDNDGVLRAVLSADSPAALDMLRRESSDLNRALADAGVRADAQSLRFDARSGGQGAGTGEGWQRDQQPHGASQSRGLADEGALDLPDPIYRSLNASGHVDLMA